jgi:putative membrane-bound dehydrogenase-like protein
MRGFHEFASWDETYVHRLHNEKDRTVLSYRVDAEGREPWTWVRTHGKGRVFYTAWGHDHRTWGNPGFQDLVERGIRWACGQDLSPEPATRPPFAVPEMNPKRTDVQPLEYVDVGGKIPNYVPSAQWGTQGEPYTKMQKPLSPHESMKHYVTPVGFQLQLFAAEPDLGGKPIAMNWDERGRLWVCETIDYPNELQPSGQGRDRIRICEDTNQDGIADKFTLFAEKLSIPTAITFYRGGAIVQNGVETLYLKDTDGDDRADVRKVLIENWALGDTHGGVSNLRYGHDNWIWGMQGYNFSEPIIEGQRQQGFRMGFFRFRLNSADPPSVTDIEFIRSTDNNTWGIGLSEEGIVFGSTANRNPSVYMPIANRYYEQVQGWSPSQLRTMADTFRFKPITDHVRQVDQHGGYTAGAGHALYTARSYPQTWWNRTAFVCGPTGHLVGTFVVHPAGADFHSNNPVNLVASDDEWAAPIAAEVGPDGHVWILDWYNFIVQHNPTPRGFRTGKGNAYETDLRDKRYGRIYRVVYEQADPQATAWQSLADADPSTLVKVLSHPTMTWRLHAQRLLVERGDKAVVPELVRLIQDRSVDDIGLNVAAIHALRVLEGLDAIRSDGAVFEAVVASLTHPSAGVRRNALQVLPPDQRAIQAIIGHDLLNSPDGKVRLAALLALADMPGDESAGQALAKSLSRGMTTVDRWTIDGTTSAAARHALPFLRTACTTDLAYPDLARPILQIAAEHFARSRPPAEGIEALLESLSFATDANADAIVGGFVRGWPDDHRPTLSSGAQEFFLPILNRLSTEGKGQLIRLAKRLGSSSLEEQAAGIVQQLSQLVENASLDDSQRISAARSLIEMDPESPQIVDRIIEQLGPLAAPELVAGLLESVALSDAEGTAEKLIESVRAMTPASRAAAIRVLLRRRALTEALLDAIESRRLDWSDLALDQKQALSNYPTESIRSRARQLLAAGGSLPDRDRQRVLEELLPLAHAHGDSAAGKAVFQKHCAKCHRIRGEGENIGPDLTGMAVHPKTELLMHIIDPSRSVEGNFKAFTLVTQQGQVLNGMLAAESRTSLELVDTEGKRHAIQRSDIDELVSSTKSVMPEGFEKQIAAADLTNLLEFLIDSGPFVPLPLDKVATAISTKSMFTRDENGPDRMVFSDWGRKTYKEIPFLLTDPRDDSVPNIILLHGPMAPLPRSMPRSVSLPCHATIRTLHLLSGISGWGFPYSSEKSVSMIVRFHYEDGVTEDHPLLNGEHFADYIRRVDVPQSEFAFDVRQRQLRYLAVDAQRSVPLTKIEFVKGDDRTAPIIMAVTAER